MGSPKFIPRSRSVFGTLTVVSLVAIGLCWAHPPLESESTVASVDLDGFDNVAAIFPDGTENTREYTFRTAKQMGVDPAHADWILGHESHYGKEMRGDRGLSRGYWMISAIYHPEVSTACGDDLQCSTEWSLKRMHAGFINEWATWRFRCQWYQEAPECPQ